ncbi:MAG: hypothetical protein J6Y90_06920 [Lachnospiraceae bacterium]|nr:hypothetical protein [Lachnospiraceae bacterium]
MFNFKNNRNKKNRTMLLIVVILLCVCMVLPTAYALVSLIISSLG